MPSLPFRQLLPRAGQSTVTTTPTRDWDWDGVERRSDGDRRNFDMQTLLGGGQHVRRRQGRRATDHGLPIVDWHDPHLLAVSITILLLCCADAWLTLMLLSRGATEANPFMASLIEHDVAVFTGVKTLLTGLGVAMLVVLAPVRVAGPLRAWHLLYVVLAGYGWLIAYELQLLAILS
jgi:hypothetical protein